MVTWRKPGRPIVLASRSPRRREIMARMGFTFRVRAPGAFDEGALVDPRRLAASIRKLAGAKALSIAGKEPGALVLGADTVVVLRGRVLGKPSSRAEARAMLGQLSGRRHRVYTGVALVCREDGFSADDAACTDVFFRKIGIDEIDEYLERDEYRDKAGSYAIQERAMTFVDRIIGCYYNVVGLPVAATIGLFRSYIRSRE